MKTPLKKRRQKMPAKKTDTAFLTCRIRRSVKERLVGLGHDTRGPSILIRAALRRLFEDIDKGEDVVTILDRTP